MRIRTAVTLLLLLTAPAIPAAAQGTIVAADDPCIAKLVRGLEMGGDPAGYGWALSLLSQLEWSDTERLGRALVTVRLSAIQLLDRVEKARSQGSQLSATERATWKGVADCVPWLLSLAKRLNDELKKQGVNVIAAQQQRNQQRTEAMDREKAARETAETLDNVAAGLRLLLKPR